ncbi:TPA: hypothetical protein RVR73_001958 [Aeromonas hydrophila]|uniref:hypothetical protein n=1 Tax=Aeromonas hydrophila TaxID=644 RepID=UPI00191FB45C|nr:hypothetical protein [Aeromonas hydrophila]MBL0570987.1 hypothetical protein [Aeromonas hydrophila]HEA3130649.1 hypothetical protein [Aeromonas hydrophila]
MQQIWDTHLFEQGIAYARTQKMGVQGLLLTEFKRKSPITGLFLLVQPVYAAA